MTALSLKIAVADYAHTRPLKTGEVPIAGARPEFVDIAPTHEIFRLMIREQAFHVAEMALTTFLLARFFGKPVVGLPVMLMRMFHHGTIWCRSNAGIETPKDLEGRRVAVRSFAQTGPTWSRGILQTEYDLDLERVVWTTFEDSHVPECSDPPNVVRARDGQTLRGMLKDGQVDAAISLDDLSDAGARPLFADSERLERQWFLKTRIYPINHIVVVRKDVAEAHPEILGRLFEAFVQAKEVGLAKAESSFQNEAVLRTRRIVGGDPLPYGIEPNRVALEAIADYVQRQRIIPHRYSVESMFEADLRGLKQPDEGRIRRGS